MEKSFFNTSYSINCQGKLIDLSSPKVMGIMNITPDSFYNKSRFMDKKSIEYRTHEIIEEGGDIIDIGAYSSRPGAKHISEQEEWERLSQVFDIVRKIDSDIIISIDTFRSEIARRAVGEYGVNRINDISSGDLDEKMFETVAELNVPYIMMHMLGTPNNMQDNSSYTHIVQEILLFFAKKVKILNTLGVSDIIIDPGFGFGKTVDHNYELLAKLDDFKVLELPILVGVSRKSMIYKHLDITSDKALNGTSILNTIALTNGASILRVHDVKEAKEATTLFGKIRDSE